MVAILDHPIMSRRIGSSPRGRGRTPDGETHRAWYAGQVAGIDEHVRELLKLSLEDRAHAAKLLLDSLDDDPDAADAEALRAAELTRRAQAVANGSATLVDADEVRRRVAARLRNVRGL